MNNSSLYIRNIGTLVTPLERDRDARDRALIEISNAAILIQNSRIAAVGGDEKVRSLVPPETPEFDAEGSLALPGLIDCHTHPVFVGNRADEFHLRNAGKSYLEIAEAGGGIQKTAHRVAAASVEQIVTESLPRFDRSLMSGVTTIEAKSGYGLEWDAEYKLLRALEMISGEVPQRVHRTHLIHALPANRAADRAMFVSEVISHHIPAVVQYKLATGVDVFCESGAFSVDESRRILTAAKSAGLAVTVHANQFGHSGGALLAAELGARSADHLEYLNEAEIDALADAKVTGIVLPAAVFFLGNLPYPPVRNMIARGMRVAIATDMNPGSASTESLPFCLTAAAIYCKMTPAELLWGVTLDPAHVLGVQGSVGSLEVGKYADITLWKLPNLDSLSYHFGNVRPATVFVDGTVAWEDRDSTARY